MSKDMVVQLRQPEGQYLLSRMLREGAQRLSAEALQVEFDVSHFAERRDGQGRAAVVRNGWQPQREVLAGLGPVGVRVAKARSRPGIFKEGPGMPVIANGELQEKDFIEGALDSQRCDMVYRWREPRSRILICSMCSRPARMYPLARTAIGAWGEP